VESMSEKTWTT